MKGQPASSHLPRSQRLQAYWQGTSTMSPASCPSPGACEGSRVAFASQAQSRGPSPQTHHAQLLSYVQLFETPETIAHQTPLSMGFPRQHWSGLPFPSSGDLHGASHLSRFGTEGLCFPWGLLSSLMFKHLHKCISEPACCRDRQASTISESITKRCSSCVAKS